ncbi:MAG: zinc-binding dehydrogenase, partial [Rhodospirillales bacterium]
MDACELDKYGKAGPVEVIVFGGGPIGLLFVGALAMAGHQVILADPNPSRLAVGKALGAAKTVEIVRGGGQADVVQVVTNGGKGAWVAVDASGVPEVWVDAINCVRPGGLVNLFGGCAPGTSIELDTHLVHYSELTVKGVYHHRPDTVRRALQLLADPAFKADLLLSAEMSIDDTEAALRAMIAKDALKVVVKS